MRITFIAKPEWANYFFLWRFFRSFFFRLCVAILCRFLFLPHGTDLGPFQ